MNFSMACLNLDYALQVCDWDTEDHKQGVNNHANVLDTLDVIYHLINVPVNHTRSIDL